ncbi:MAG: hypothetical protein CR967_05240 [Proteobacteria bacterium]|nr:MAG: hypothetical protein CR967_05240 [Pseudomonadota bacterium]
MSNVLNKLFSIKVGLVLLLVFALSCAVATFIENDFGTQSAFALVYGSWWFGLIQLWLGILVFHNIFRFNLLRMEKLPSLMFHFSFIFILFGSILTRYYGFEGLMHIREGAKQNLVSSATPHVHITSKKDGKLYSNSKAKLFSFIGGNSYDLDLDIDGKTANFKYLNIIPNATKEIIKDENYPAIISLMISMQDKKPLELVLREGEFRKFDGFFIGFNSKEKNDLPSFNISLDDGKFYFSSNKKTSWYKMSDGSKGEYEADKKIPFLSKQLYGIEDISIVPKKLFQHGKQTFVSGKEGFKNQTPTALIGLLNYDGKSKEVALLKFGSQGMTEKVSLSDQTFSLRWGAKMYELPFSLELIDFQLDRYPGSMSPSSYASEVKVLDAKDNINMPFRIYMNHVLDYKGFRFFQSSYDRDEGGTILSVNKDPGKIPTYIGYFLLFLGLFLNIINPKSRFRKLAMQVNKNTLSKTTSLLLFAFMILGGNTLNASPLPTYDKEHANLFGTILAQSVDGRIKPVDTISHEVLSKVARSSDLKGQNANQVLLGMLTNPASWQQVPMIKIHHRELKKLLGIDQKAKYASFDDFFEKDGDKRYKLIGKIERAKRKKPSDLNTFDKDLIKVDERLNVCYLVYTGELLKIFPRIGDKHKTWLSPNSALMYLPKSQSSQIQEMLEEYFDGVRHGVKTGDWKRADSGVERIKTYQKQYASSIIPSQNKVYAEIYFNNFQIFFKLFPVYLLLGFLLLFSILFKIFIPSMNLKILNNLVLKAFMIAFVVHTIGLGMRWYISGHAPWSDGYESMVYIAWALALAGILFSKKSPISLALTAILAGVFLFVAHLSWMDPQITNLVPVLKSYWLTIHVSIITASYGFLGLCSLLGFFTLVLFILRSSKKNDSKGLAIDSHIKEASKINEMSMILGLSLLTIGNFLGGIWANESWGRYWGWDAKETWALISILIYAAVVHMRFIPKLNNQYAFAVASTFAYWSIIMTYFGVNFYLSGMHSYASGDPIPIPIYVPIIAGIMLLFSVLAYFKRKIGSRL